MKRKNNRGIVVKVLNSKLLFYPGIMFLYVLWNLHSFIISQNLDLLVIILLMTIFIVCLMSNVFKQKIVIYTDKIKDGDFIIENTDHQVYYMNIKILKYKIFEKENKILLQDERYSVLFHRNKMLIKKLEEIGALENELK